MILSLADAMVTALNNAELESEIEFTAVKNLLPSFDREIMGTALSVTVVPASLGTAGRLDKRRSRKEVGMDIGFAQFLTTAATEVSALIELVEEIQVFIDEQLPVLAGCSYLRSEFDPLYDSRMLRDNSLFMSVLAVVYQKN